MGIDFFKNKNGYEIEGFWLPRVTSITGIISKPGLFRYYAQQANFAVAQEALNHAANWGTLTHETIEKFFKDEPVQIDPKILPSVQAFQEWQNQNVVRVLDPASDVEKMIYDLDEVYAGTMDALIEINGVLGILDIKTGSGIWDEHSLQLAAYMNAYNKSAPAKRQAQTRWILRLDQFEECIFCQAKKRIKSGQPRIGGGNPACSHTFAPAKGVVEFKELKNLKHDIEGFLSAKKLWEWCNQALLGQIENYPKAIREQKLF